MNNNFFIRWCFYYLIITEKLKTFFFLVRLTTRIYGEGLSILDLRSGGTTARHYYVGRPLSRALTIDAAAKDATASEASDSPA